MRVRDHIAISTTGAIVLYPLFGRHVLGAWVGSVLIDLDHYLWFGLKERSIDPVAAVRYYSQADSPHHRASRILHSPLVIGALLGLGAWNRKILPVAVGMAAHVALDAYQERHMTRSRAAALRRDKFTCQECGATGPGIVTHLIGQPPLLPSYALDNLVTLCSSCHEAAHARPEPRRGAIAVLLAGFGTVVAR